MDKLLILDQLKISFFYTLQILLILFFFGVLFSYIEKKNSASIYRVFGMNGLIFTGFIGTIVHEFSHMVFCTIFRHEITEFALFRPYKSRYDGIMGYVNHSCNKNSIYQRVGNFFIGIAPIIFGTGLLILCMWILVPSAFDDVSAVFSKNMQYMSHIHSIKDSINIYISIVAAIIVNLNPFKQTNVVGYIVFLYIMYSVTTHMDLSKEDLINSRSGLFVFIVMLYIITLIFTVLGIQYEVILLRVVVSIFSFLTVGLFFATFTVMISKFLESIIFW